MVLGAGTMGAGIVQTAAQAGFEVIVRDIKQEFVDRGIAGIDKLLGKNVDKGKMSAEDKAAIMGRISGTVDMAAAAECDLVIEAALEVMDIKKSIFKELGRYMQTRMYSGHQHLSIECYRNCCRHRQSGQGNWNAFL